MNRDDDIIKIDLDGVLRARMPRYYRFIPGWLVRRLERLIRQDELNGLLSSNAGKRDAEFCSGILSDLEVSYDVRGMENLPLSADGRLTFVCNHPLGALDGIVMIDFVSRHFGSGVKFIVNDLLMAIEPLRGTFVPINKHGAQHRGTVCDVDAAFSSDAPVIVFPAGLCSRKNEAGEVKDLTWNKMFVNKCIDYRRRVVPVFFDGHNSNFFYNFAKLRVAAGLKFNMEMVLLPREVFLNRGNKFTLHIGTPIEWNTLRGGKEALAQAASIKDAVYALKL